MQTDYEQIKDALKEIEYPRDLVQKHENQVSKIKRDNSSVKSHLNLEVGKEPHSMKS